MTVSAAGTTPREPPEFRTSALLSACWMPYSVSTANIYRRWVVAVDGADPDKSLVRLSFSARMSA